MGLYWIKRVNGKKQRVWNYGRARGINEARDRIGDIEKEVGILLKTKNKIKVLEIGCGYGKLLLELKKIFGERVSITGINKEEKWNLSLIKKFAIAEKIFNKEEITKNLPKLYILDVDKKFPFKANSFDLVYSVRTIQYVSNKVRYLENLNKIIKPNGIAITDIQDGSQNRWEVRDNYKKISIYKLLSKKKNIQLYQEKGNPKDKYIKMKKDKNFNLNLKLVSTVDLHKINKDWWGKKSTFILNKH